MVSDEIICLFFHFLKMDSLQANLAIVSHAVRIFFTTNKIRTKNIFHNFKELIVRASVDF